MLPEASLSEILLLPDRSSHLMQPGQVPHPYKVKAYSHFQELSDPDTLRTDYLACLFPRAQLLLQRVWLKQHIIAGQPKRASNEVDGMSCKSDRDCMPKRHERGCQVRWYQARTGGLRQCFTS
jgi:hypothetical protein